MPLPPIKGFLETSFIDWPGQIAAVLFLPGCNFNCPYCHNRQLLDNAHNLATLAWPEVKARLRQFSGWLDGVVISGGEPTLHKNLPALLAALKELGFKTKLDTNGSKPRVLRALLEQNLLDMIAMDWKAPLEELAYGRACGGPVDLRALEQSRRLVVGIEHQFRATVWPAWHGGEEIKLMARQVGSPHFVLQAMRVDGLEARQRKIMGSGAPYSPEQINALQAMLQSGAI